MGTPMPSQQAERFRALHAGPRLLVLPNAWDVISARKRSACCDCIGVPIDGPPS